MSKQAIAIAGGLLVASSIVRAAEIKPNVIFIKTDDQRLDSLSMTGHHRGTVEQWIKTVGRIVILHS